MLTLAVALLGCPESVSELKLGGPSEVVVDRLGSVDLPMVLLSDGSEPTGVVWRVSDAEVARVEDGAVIATAAGQVRVIGSWRDQEVSWTLVVEPTLQLFFVGVPATLTVGQTESLKVLAKRAGEEVPAGALSFSSSAPGILRVDVKGTATGISAGMAYVTAKGGGGEAMAEIAVK